MRNRSFPVSILFVLFLFIAVSGCTSIKNNVKTWDRYDTAYQATYLVLTAVDLAQTHWMAKNDWTWDGHSHSEICPLFFNSKPHQDAADVMIPLGMIAHTGIALVLPPKYKVLGFEINPRRIWQLLWIVTEASAVGDNFGGGAKIEF